MNDIQLYRVIMPAADIGASEAFYSSLLDQSAIPVSGGRRYYRCGGVVLAVYSPAGDGDPATPHANFGHVYFAVDGIETYFARAKGLDCLDSSIGDGGMAMGEIATRPWGERSFYCHDPLGNPLCFVDRATLFTGPG